MGRKKIQITRIQDERNRQITFSKRKAGLLKKAYELSILCDVEIAVIMITGGNKLYQYASTNMNSILIRYTEFKDPDESKTNADILDDITRREKDKGGKDSLSGDEDDDPTHLPLTPNTQARYQRIDEEFDQVLRQEQNPIHQISQHQPQHQPQPQPQPQAQPNPQPPSIVYAAASVPQAMPVSIPVSSSPDLQLKPMQYLGSAGSSRPTSASTLSPDTPVPGASRNIKSPSSVGSMPLPAGTPTRLQTIRNQTLKLHLPGGGRNYVSLPSTASPSPKVPDDKVANEKQSDSNDLQQQHNRPQLKVVIPGQKGFVPKTAPSSPPPIIDIETPPSTTDRPPVTTTKASLSTSVAKNDSLTTPIMSLTTPSIFSSSIPPSLSALPSEFPLSSVIGGDGGVSTSALVAFPISIQPGAGNTPGSNLIIQAQNMGQPFLLTPTPSDKQNPSLTPPSSYSSIKDLEQLKMQYDKIYQQISETLQFHEQSKQVDSGDDAQQNDSVPGGGISSGVPGGGISSGHKRENEQHPVAGVKRPHLDNTQN